MSPRTPPNGYLAPADLIILILNASGLEFASTGFFFFFSSFFHFFLLIHQLGLGCLHLPR